jgi:hypothetical protein
VSSWRGITRIQKWPKPRGPAKTKAEGDRRQIFALMQRLVKWLTHWETNYAREAVKAHNDANTGQRGSAAIRLRDWQTQRMYGRAVAVIVDSKLTFYPTAVGRDASFIMDHTTADHGQISQRTTEDWEAITMGEPNQYLLSGGPGANNYFSDL